MPEHKATEVPAVSKESPIANLLEVIKGENILNNNKESLVTKYLSEKLQDVNEIVLQGVRDMFDDMQEEMIQQANRFSQAMKAMSDDLIAQSEGIKTAFNEVQAAFLETQRAIHQPRRVELVKDEDGRPVGAVSRVGE